MLHFILLASTAYLILILLLGPAVGRCIMTPELAEFEARLIREAHLQRRSEEDARIRVGDMGPAIATRDLLALAAASEPAIFEEGEQSLAGSPVLQRSG
jgi:hypothetical protein